MPAHPRPQLRAEWQQKVVVVQPLQCSVYILTGGDGNCALLHAMERAVAAEGMALAGHRDSSTLFRDVTTGRRAMPDFTLVSTHAGAIEVNGEASCLARFATVHWGHSCLVKRVKRGVAADDTDGDSDWSPAKCGWLKGRSTGLSVPLDSELQHRSVQL